MKRVGIILTSVITSLITALVVVWFSEVLVQIAPSPQRLWLRVENALSATPSRVDASFRIVLCWLENDWSGEDTRNVEDAFSGVEGITLVVSDEDIFASGAADEWRPAMQRSALAILEDWNADVAIVGSVKRSGEALALWFVPRRGEGTLRRADRYYTLEMGTLGADFHEDLRTQLAVMAWNSIASLVDAEKRGRVFKKGLQTATEKLSRLLGTPTIKETGTSRRLVRRIRGWPLDARNAGTRHGSSRTGRRGLSKSTHCIYAAASPARMGQNTQLPRSCPEGAGGSAGGQGAARTGHRRLPGDLGSLFSRAYASQVGCGSGSPRHCTETYRRAGNRFSPA